MNDRYSRQTRFRPIGEKGQAQIEQKHVLIMGMGALGTAVAGSLVRAGIGMLTIVDRDYVESSNLQRQQLFSEEDAKQRLPKAIAAKKRLNEINSSVNIKAFVMDATSTSLPSVLDGVDLVIDATDNFDIRLVLNDLMQKYRIPWIYGSCVGSTGMSYTILPGVTPCLHCLLQTIPAHTGTCDTVGIIAPAVHIVAAHQTTEALKLLVGATASLRSHLLIFDLWNNQYLTMDVNHAKKADCPSCGTAPTFPYLTYEAQTKSEVLCGRDTVLIRSNRNRESLEQLSKKLASYGDIQLNPYLLSLTYNTYRLVFFQDGRTFVHGTNSIEKAKSIYYGLLG